VNSLIAIGLRNVGRNRRRTWLTVGGIGFAIWLVGVSVALQDGQYALQRQTATDLVTGHVQLSHPDWPDRSSVEFVLADVESTLSRVAAVEGVQAVFPRVQFFGMAAAGEKSAASQVIGIDFTLEQGHTTLIHRLSAGVMPSGVDECLLGEAMARLLGVGPGDAVDVLAADPAGGMAAMSLTVAGLLRTGVPDLDRGLLVVPYAAAAAALGMPDQAHLIVVRGESPEAAWDLARRLEPVMPRSTLVRTWQAVMPEIEEAIELDQLGGYPFYGVILFLVTFSVANTFVMVVFERIREFGMLRSLGMQPLGIIGLLQIESLTMWLGGALLGLVILVVTIAILATTGIPLGERLEATLSQMYMPTRMYADFSVRALVTAPLVLLVSTQVAAFLPALRIRHIQPAHALRMGGA
jgi:ABC-type lipoprotein release transport system permease subunit